MNTRLSLILGCLILAACSAPPPPTAAPITVKTVVVGAAAGESGRRYSGEIHARYELPLGFRIGGKLASRAVDLGTHVTAGQALAQLDPADVALQAEQARAQLAYAEADARRYRDLKTKNFVSPAALDAKETALKAAEAQAGLAANQRGYATLVADRPGVVAALLAEPGQVLTAGQPVIRLAQDGEREVVIALPEAERAAVKVGDPATISLWANGAEYRGKVRELSPAADPLTRTYAARIAIANADASLGLGMSANVAFDSRPKPALTVPLTAVFQQGAAAAVWIVTPEQTVRLQPVTLAGYSDAGAIVATGLAGGERVVAAGVHRLNEGEKIRVAP